MALPSSYYIAAAAYRAERNGRAVLQKVGAAKTARRDPDIDEGHRWIDEGTASAHCLKCLYTKEYIDRSGYSCDELRAVGALGR